jgi:hypothetical protein
MHPIGREEASKSNRKAGAPEEAGGEVDPFAGEGERFSCSIDLPERTSRYLSQENPVRKLIATSALCFFALFLMQATAHAQQLDVAYGGGTLTAPGASSASGSYSPQSLAGGFYNTISGDVIFFHHLGAGAEVSWRGSNNYYQGNVSLPYKPVLFDFDGVYAPPLIPRVQPQLQAGIGVEDIRFYSSSFCSIYTGTCYATSKHFMGHLGAGLKIYLLGGFFVRPEADVYLVHNNVEFSSLYATKVGLSIGFTLGPH